MSTQLFTKLPQFLFNDDSYASVSNGAKLLYSILSDRSQLSQKNHKQYTDKFGVFVIFARENLAKLLSCSRQTISRYMKELVNVGLILDRRLGLNKANHIYINDIETIKHSPKIQKKSIKSSKKKNKTPKDPTDTGCHIIEHQEVIKVNANQTNYSQTDKNLSSSKKKDKKIEKSLIEKIDMGSLPDPKTATMILELLTSVKQLPIYKTFRINGKNIQLTEILPLLDNLTTETMKELCNRFKLPRHIFSPLSFILAILYNLSILSINHDTAQYNPPNNAQYINNSIPSQADGFAHLIHFF